MSLTIMYLSTCFLFLTNSLISSIQVFGTLLMAMMVSIKLIDEVSCTAIKFFPHLLSL